jgi:hypothetical protein
MHTRVAALIVLRCPATSRGTNHKRLSGLCLASQHHPAAAIRQGNRSALRDSRLCQVQGFQKLRNIERDRRVALTVSDPGSPARYYEVRGDVTGISTDGAAEHIEKLAQCYLGTPYPWYGGRDQVRVLLTIQARRITAPLG